MDKDVQFGRIRFIRGDNGGKYPFNHSVYLEGKDVRVIIDPSCSLRKLSDLKEKDGVDQVWLSHWHEDHMGFLNLFDNCTLRISQRDFPPLDLGSLKVKLVATPGHTPGHLSFFFPDEESLFLGDYDLTTFGPWYGDVYSGIEQTITSLRKLKY
jgi:glyoxylase-like metal-dependent hydrolase (beta-lactamase superfamily II)